MADGAATIEHGLHVVEKTHWTRQRLDDDRRGRRGSTSQSEEDEDTREDGNPDHADLSNSRGRR
jgi:hypothetical protein